MGVVSDRKARRARISPTCVMTVVALLCHGTARSALPPSQGRAPEPVPASAATPTQSRALSALIWYLPPVSLDGVVGYMVRSDSFAGKTGLQSTLNTTLNASTNTYIWQPWFAQVDGSLAFSSLRDNSREDETGKRSGKNVVITGRGQLSVLTQSKFPFEAHFERSDTSVSNSLALDNAVASQRFGFSQRYSRPQGDASFGWDRRTQTRAEFGRNVQDNLELRMSHRMEPQNFQFTGTRSTDKHEFTGERAVLNNLSLQHSVTPNPSISLNSSANIGQSDYRLRQGNTDSRLLLLSSAASWRPEGRPMTVTGGVQMFTVQTGSGGMADSGNTVDNGLFSVNANLGVSYAFNSFTSLNAGANVNMSESGGTKIISSSQSVSAAYSPAPIALGPFSYNWSTGASGSNSMGGDESTRQLALQFSHSLSRSFTLSGGSTISVDGSQGVSVSASSGSAASEAEPQSTKTLSHNGSVQWSLPQYGNSTVRLTASDTRALDGRQEYFQLINMQASSSLASSGLSSWSGNLAIQATRQGNNSRSRANGSSAESDGDKGFQVSSSGSVSYQHSRLFGYRRLRFNSDLRLNSDAILPLFGGDQDQEIAAWDNRFDYSIGLTQLRLGLSISRSSSPKSSVRNLTGVENADKESKINKSIVFSVSRSFGIF